MQDQENEEDHTATAHLLGTKCCQTTVLPGLYTVRCRSGLETCLLSPGEHQGRTVVVYVSQLDDNNDGTRAAQRFPEIYFKPWRQLCIESLLHW